MFFDTVTWRGELALNNCLCYVVYINNLQLLPFPFIFCRNGGHCKCAHFTKITFFTEKVELLHKNMRIFSDCFFVFCTTFKCTIEVTTHLKIFTPLENALFQCFDLISR